MRIDEILAAKDGPVFSFEFFPPKTEEGEANLQRALAELRRARARLRLGHLRRRRLDARPHDRHRQVDQGRPRDRGDGPPQLRGHDQRAARRDPRRDPRGRDRQRARAARRPAARRDGVAPTPGGLRVLDRARSRCSPSATTSRSAAACFPEVHPEAPDLASDLRFLAEKVDAGRGFLITQLFFDNRLYFDFVREARARGDRGADHPGHHPRDQRRADQALHLDVRRLDPRGPARAARRCARTTRLRCVELGVAYATAQCADLLARGAPGIHFYTLNKSPATRAILSALRLLAPLGAGGPGSSRRAGPRRRDLERVGDVHAPVALVAHVDGVVLAVGADPPRSEEPAPQPEPALLGQRPLEEQRPAADVVVLALALGDAVDVDLERRPHAAAAAPRASAPSAGQYGRRGQLPSPAVSEQAIPYRIRRSDRARRVRVTVGAAEGVEVVLPRRARRARSRGGGARAARLDRAPPAGAGARARREAGAPPGHVPYLGEALRARARARPHARPPPRRRRCSFPPATRARRSSAGTAARRGRRSPRASSAPCAAAGLSYERLTHPRPAHALGLVLDQRAR